jgi:inactivated superfamily I helicase
VGRGRRQFAVVAWEHVVGDYRQRGSEKPAMIEMVAMRLHEKLTLSPSWADVFDDVMRRDTVHISCSKTRAVSIWGCSEVVHLVGRM